LPDRLALLTGVVMLLSPLPSLAQAEDSPFEIITRSQVDSRGRVQLHLALKNISRQPLYHVHPMFHFHHSKSMLDPVTKLGPGESVEWMNRDHPPVVRVGRYPLAVMVHYQKGPATTAEHTQLHTDSFYFREQLESEIAGEIKSTQSGEDSLLQVMVKNNSSALKNIQMILLLPPQLSAEKFNGIMGLTLQGGEEIHFEIPVQKAPGQPEGSYPLFLTIEYGEMLQHFTGAIEGRANFSPKWSGDMLLPNMVAATMLGLFLFYAYRKKYKWDRRT